MALLDMQIIPGSTGEFAPDRGEDAFLNHLRFVALECRVKARADLFEACALLVMDKEASVQAHAEALVRSLNEALSKPAILFRPGVRERSFDEAWLLQLAIALRNEDAASARFLLHSRIRAEHRRHIHFLVGRLSAYLL